MFVKDPKETIIMNNEQADTVVEAHEWECRTCGYFLRLEFGPLWREGGECKKCHQAVKYHGLKNVLQSQLGVTKAK